MDRHLTFILVLLFFALKTDACKATDQKIETVQEKIFELVLYNLPLLDHAIIYNFALVNKKLFNDVITTKNIRKEALVKNADNNNALCTSKLSASTKSPYNVTKPPHLEYIYFNRYGSVCIYFTYKKIAAEQEINLYCNWTTCSSGILNSFSHADPTITIDISTMPYKPHVPWFPWKYYYFEDKKYWEIINGEAAYSAGHYLKGPYMLNNNSGFCFLDKKYNIELSTKNKICYF